MHDSFPFFHILNFLHIVNFIVILPIDPFNLIIDSNMVRLDLNFHLFCFWLGGTRLEGERVMSRCEFIVVEL